MLRRALAAAGIAACLVTTGWASSHREAPLITRMPKVDSTDFYMFRSYESGRDGFVVLIATYQPLQDPVGGPNYFFMDDDALYEIHVENSGDANEDITFQFKFQNTFSRATVDSGDGTQVEIPLLQGGGIGPGVADTGNKNLQETYTLDVTFGDRRTGTRLSATEASSGSSTFTKPTDNIGQKTISNYQTYSQAHIFNVNFPVATGGTVAGRVFVGQVADPFYVNLGETFDLINITDPIEDSAPEANQDQNDLAGKNVTALAIEVPISYLTQNGARPKIGGWTSASKRQAGVFNPFPSDTGNTNNATVEGGAWTQVSRLGMPLVNEVAIPVGMKDLFNAGHPSDDARFLSYVTDPILPIYMEAVLGVPNPGSHDEGLGIGGREDLVLLFLTGHPALGTLPGGFELGGPIPGEDGKNFGAFEALRMNLTAPSGFPNGRLVGDDVVDVALDAMAGLLIDGTMIGGDGVGSDGLHYLDTFPFMGDPWSGNPE